MPRPKPAEAIKQRSVVYPVSWEDRLEALRVKMAPEGVELSTAQILRACLENGLATLEKKHGLKAAKKEAS